MALVPLTPGFLFSEAESPALFGIEIDIDGKAVTAAYSGDGFYDPAVMPCTPLCGMADTDCDGMFDDADVDDDGDGCSDVAEGGPNPGAGGMRNSKYGRDFYDVNDSGDIDLGDTLLVLAVFGDIAFAGTPADERDRFAPVAGSPWQTAKASDGVGLADALLNLQSFGHSC